MKLVIFQTIVSLDRALLLLAATVLLGCSGSDGPASNQPPKEVDDAKPELTAAPLLADVTQQDGGPRQEIVKIRIPASVKVNVVTVMRKDGTEGRIVALGKGKYEVTADEGHVFSSNGHYLVSGSIVEKEVTGGEFTLAINLLSSESTEAVRTRIETLLSQCSSITYFDNATVVHGVHSPANSEMVIYDEPQEIQGIIGLSFKSGQSLDEDGFASIRFLQYLTRLFLSYTSVSDSHLAHLKELHHLRVIYLSETEITDDGLLHLENMAQLNALGLRGTQVSDKGVENLRRLMPGTRIER